MLRFDKIELHYTLYRTFVYDEVKKKHEKSRNILLRWIKIYPNIQSFDRQRRLNGMEFDGTTFLRLYVTKFLCVGKEKRKKER